MQEGAASSAPTNAREFILLRSHFYSPIASHNRLKCQKIGFLRRRLCTNVRVAALFGADRRLLTVTGEDSCLVGQCEKLRMD